MIFCLFNDIFCEARLYECVHHTFFFSFPCINLELEWNDQSVYLFTVPVNIETAANKHGVAKLNEDVISFFFETNFKKLLYWESVIKEFEQKI